MDIDLGQIGQYQPINNTCGLKYLHGQLSLAGVLWGIFAILLVGSCFRFLRLDLGGFLIHPNFLILPLIYVYCQNSVWSSIKRLGVPGIGMFIFFNVLLLSCLLNGVTITGVTPLIKWFASFSIIVLVATTLETRKDIVFVLKCAVISISLIYLYGIFLYIISGSYALNPFSEIGTRNALSNFTAAFFGASFFFAIIFPISRKERFLFGICLLIVTCGQILTYNRSGLICLFISFILAFLYKPKFKTMILVLLVVMTIFWTLPAEKVNSLTNRYSLILSGEKTSGDQQRYIYFRKALKMASVSPLFGHGPASFQYPTNRREFSPELEYYNYTAPSHNIYFTVVSEYGLLGLLSFLLFICSVFFLLMRSFLHASIAVEKHLGFILLIGLISLLIRGLFSDSILFMPSNSLFLGLLLSYSLNRTSEEKSPE